MSKNRCGKDGTRCRSNKNGGQDSGDILVKDLEGSHLSRLFLFFRKLPNFPWVESSNSNLGGMQQGQTNKQCGKETTKRCNIFTVGRKETLV
jgi:hypothetical protein